MALSFEIPYQGVRETPSKLCRATRDRSPQQSLTQLSEILETIREARLTPITPIFRLASNFGCERGLSPQVTCV